MIEKDKWYLVTGASGFLGRALCRKIVDDGGRIVALARNEGNLIKLKQDFEANQLIIIPGDIEDKCIVEQAMQDISGMFHLAAFKHVTMAEEHTLQCVTTNVHGSINLLEAVKDSNQCKFIITTSTDKAAQIKGVYGASKYIVEKLFQQYSNFDPYTKYRVVRYGNVLWSTGSVIPKWSKLLLEGKPITVTNPLATRFYFSRDEAIGLIFRCLKEHDSATPLIPKMKSIQMFMLAEAMARKYFDGMVTNDTIRTSQLEGSENMHETMDGKNFSDKAEKWDLSELRDLI